MKDIHSHILFGIDDGSQSLEESIAIIQNAVDNGYTDVILTPHYRESQNYICDNRTKRLLFANLKNQVEARGLPINLYLGNEVTIDDDFFYNLQTAQLESLNNSKYMLLELPFSGRLSNLDATIRKLRSLGCTPIIAHPERYEDYRDFDELEHLLCLGVLFQGNIASLYGKYGPKAKLQLEEMLKRHMIHFLGSDVHSKHNSTYARASSIRSKVLELTGSAEMVDDLFDNNILKVINDLTIYPYPIRKFKRKINLTKVFNKNRGVENYE